ncbi:hypothetical protein LZ30DRAFT_469296 [Colletotrichum cereale]|nr:hypothetical protein LZ30DRAFT_469296 [Colletotrichum cereale]
MGGQKRRLSKDPGLGDDPAASRGRVHEAGLGVQAGTQSKRAVDHGGRCWDRERRLHGDGAADNGTVLAS